MWSKILKFALKYGKKAVKWVWKHRRALIEMGIWAAMELIDRLFG